MSDIDDLDAALADEYARTDHTDIDPAEFYGRTDPKAPYLPDFTDQSVANAFVYEHQDKVLHVTEWDKWLVWSGTHWTMDQKRADRLMGSTVARIEERMQAGLAAADSSKAKGWELCLKQIRAYKNDAKLKAAMSRAKVHELIEANAVDMDAQPMLLNVQNGTINLKTGVLQPHSQVDRLTMMLDVKFDPKAKAPLWESSLRLWMSNDGDLLRYIQKAAGYTLTGSTRETCLFFTYGIGANGKSTFLNTLQKLLGSYAKTGADNLLTSREGVRPDDVAALMGRRMVVTPEIEDSRKFSEADLKRLTSSDPLNARRLYGEPFDFFPSHKLWGTGNHRPVIKGSDIGIWRRMQVIPFEVTIPDAQKDRGLEDKLRAEFEGILAWAVRGCVQWWQDGLQVPAAVLEATAEYRKEMDLVGSFVADHCEESADEFIPSTRLYERYKVWAAAQGMSHPLTQISLGRELKSRGWEQTKVSTNRWVGWKLRPFSEVM